MSEHQQRGCNHRAYEIRGLSKRTRSSAAGRAVALAAAAAVTGLTATANAADMTWVGPAATEAPYGDASNWSPALVPGSLDTARVDNGGISVITSNQSVGNLYPGSTAGSSGTFKQTGGTVTVGSHVLVAEGGSTSTGTYLMSGGALNVAGVIYAGSHGTGTFHLSGTGSISTASFQVGVQSTAVGTANISGGSITTPGLVVGHLGSGTMDLSNGTITVGSAANGGHDTLQLGLNNSASGTINQTGGTMNVLGQVQIGRVTETTSGTYDISGGTLNAFNNNGAGQPSEVSVRVGNVGTGTMKVRGTGVANVGLNLVVGGNGGSTGVGTLEVKDTGVLNVGMGAAATAGVLGIGSNGVGTSTQSGGTINTDHVLHGYVFNAVSKGESTQTGGALNVSGNMHLGRASAQNNFYSISGGTIDVGGNLTVAQLSNRTSASPTDPWAGTVSKGTLTIGGTADIAVVGQLSNSAGFTPTSGVNSGIAQPGGVGRIEMNDGTLTAGSFLNGSAANADPSHAGSGASATYVQTGGTASVGHVTGTGNVSVSGGTMNVGSLKQSAVTVTGGAVNVAANGTSTGTSDITSVTISGSGKVDLANNSLVTSGTPGSTIRQYLQTGYSGGSWTGNGLTSSSAAASPGSRALGHTTDGSGVTTVKYTVAGDANLDGSADGSDFNVWNANRFQAGVWDQGDLNYSDTVDGSDFNIWNANRFQSVAAMEPLAQSLSATASAIENVPMFVYDPATGLLNMDTNQSGTDKLVSFLVTSPKALEILKFKDGTFDENNGWAQQYFNGKEQWIATFGSGVAGAWNIADFATGLDLSSFGTVEYGVRRADGSGYTGFTAVTLVPEPSALGLIALAGLGVLRRRRRAA